MSQLLLFIKQRTLLAALFAFVSVYSVTSALSIRPALAQPLPVKTLTAGMHVIQAEVASTDATRSKGLMYRKELAPNSGMLFVFEQPNVQCFWMRNTPTPLDIGFFSADGTLLELYAMYPFDENRVVSLSQAVQFALEMNQGWFRENGVLPGAKLDLKAVAAALKERDERMARATG